MGRNLEEILRLDPGSLADLSEPGILPLPYPMALYGIPGGVIEIGGKACTGLTIFKKTLRKAANSQGEVLCAVDSMGFAETYDFFYLPMNLGAARHTLNMFPSYPGGSKQPKVAPVYFL